MTDALEQEIENKRQALAKLNAERVRLDIELSALLRAAKLRPMSAQAGGSIDSTSEVKSVPTHERKGGKPPGAISPKWREVLADAYGEGGKRKYFEYFGYASHRDISTNITAIRDRVRAWEKMGLLEGDPEIGFEVTEATARRFGFERSKLGIKTFSGDKPSTKETVEDLLS